MKTSTTSQPIRIKRNDNQSNARFTESKSSGNLEKLSQSLGTHAPGRLTRHVTNVSDIFYAGYLLKRSNKPVTRCPLPFSAEESLPHQQQHVSAAQAASSPPAPYTFLRHRSEVDVFNASDLDLSSTTSSNFHLSPTLPLHEIVQHDSQQYSELQEFAHALFGIDSSIGLFAAPSPATQRNSASSPLSAQATPPLRRTEPLQIPTPDSYYTKRDSFRQTRRTSEPSLYATSPGGSSSSCAGHGHSGTPTDVLEQDQHVWRAKYCVLENGLLYFYRHQVDAELVEARLERQQLLLELQQQTVHTPCQSKASVRTGVTTGDPPWLRPSLAMSPMHHKHEFAFMSSSHHHDDSVAAPAFPRICEKFVALSTVGAVRSAELEHGPHSFVLASEDEDPLILRAQSNEDMSEWIFQFHRSIASYVMGIMESCSLAWNSNQLIRRNKALLSARGDIAMTLSPRGHKAVMTMTDGPGTASSSLSHGHGRTLLNRKRTSSAGSTSIRLAQSFHEHRSPLALGFPILPYQQSQPAWTPPRNAQSLATPPQDAQAQEVTSPEFSAPQSDYPETERPPPSRPGKYLPPHLRNKETLSPTECISLQMREQSAHRYVPPQQRSSSSNYTSLFMRNSLIGLNPSQLHCDDATPHHVHVNAVEEEDEVTDHLMMFDETDMDDAICPDGIKLGGCADPLLVEGSILDAVYIPRKASRSGKTSTVPFGCRSSNEGQAGNRLRFEIGAVSECGIRDSNEDAFVVATDVLLAAMHNGTDMSETVWDMDDSMHPPGLFAVFDGHCGDHAARFAAERLLSYVQAHSANDSDNMSTQAERIKKVLRKAIRQLDDEFCNICVADGRDWESGATALIAALVNEQLVIANLGDARGVICRSVTNVTGMLDNGWTELPSSDYISTEGRVFWKQITSTHTPSRADERARIENANGWITFEKEIPIGQLQRMVLFDEDVLDILQRCFADRIPSASPRAAAPQRILQISRVCGELAVSRAIGDRDFKSAHNRAGNPHRPLDSTLEDEWHNASLFLPYPDNHCRSFVGDLVSNDPDFEFVSVGEPGVTDEFLLLCCDGLWDVMDSDDAVRVTRDLLFEKGWSAKQAASRLAELAIHLGSSDNITVIVIRFLERNKI
ncbi:hypothetical protein MPSEU_001014600 [Mayamaea pseudoterrestris]|nr:hypothetical protein MPSEU_001014600 [Mayamaea pseudoterrestris]